MQRNIAMQHPFIGALVELGVLNRREQRSCVDSGSAAMNKLEVWPLEKLIRKNKNRLYNVSRKTDL